MSVTQRPILTMRQFYIKDAAVFILVAGYSQTNVHWSEGGDPIRFWLYIVKAWLRHVLLLTVVDAIYFCYSINLLPTH